MFKEDTVNWSAPQNRSYSHDRQANPYQTDPIKSLDKEEKERRIEDYNQHVLRNL